LLRKVGQEAVKEEIEAVGRSLYSLIGRIGRKILGWRIVQA